MDLDEILNRESVSPIERVFAGVGLFVFSIGCLFVGLFNPSTIQVLPACPLLAITGFACPGCGLTRAFHALFHGEFLTALDFNALIPFYALAFVYLAASLVLVVIRGRGLPYKFIGPVALGAFLVVSLTFGVVRNIPSYPFSVLYP